MQLEFCYSLRIDFSSPVSGHRFTLRLMPVSDQRQHITSLNIKLSPEVVYSEGTDCFGNSFIYGVAADEHSCFKVNISGTALMSETYFSAGGSSRLRENIYLYPSALTVPETALKKFADSIDTDGCDAHEASIRVMHAVHAYMTYAPGTTGVETTAAAAFVKEGGVCQDYAHVMISVMRLKKFRARYVCGMMEGEGKSHAWVETRLDTADGSSVWYGFDPTNDIVVCDRHIKLSHGRDFRDCLINRGVFMGSATQTQEISALVKVVL